MTTTATRSPSTTRLVLGAALAGALLLGTAPTASADRVPSGSLSTTSATAFRSQLPPPYVPTAADKRMASALTSRVTTTRFGTSFTGAVLDASADATVWSKNGATALMPASTTKLVTASNALTVFGPDKRFTTRIRSGSTAGHVVLEGSGDPSLTSASLDAMAKTTAAWLLARQLTSVRVYVDDDVFPTPTLAYGWKSSYVPNSIAPVRGVVRDQRNTSDTSADAALYVRDRLKAHGVTTVDYAGRANASSTSAVLASSSGSTVATMVSRMLLNSDNEIAESLHKLVGRAHGRGATWDGARAAQKDELTAQGLTATALYDGSGLSRADRLTAVQLTKIVDRGVDPRYSSRLWPLQSPQAMPTAGRTGTLKYRFTTDQSKCAVGKVWAKTGTLSDVVSLAGFTTGADGRVKVFAFVVNGKDSTTTLKQNIDMLAATVTGCY